MKKIIYIAFAVALAAVSCSKNAEISIDPALSDGITLTFTCSEAATRADGSGVDGTGNEDRVTRIDYFIFPVGEDGKVADATEYVYNNSYTPASGQETVGTYTVTIQPGVLGQIFPNGAKKAMVFAIANYVDKFGAAGNQAGTGPALEEPNTTLPEDATTWKALHELEVGPTFFKDGGSNDHDDFGLRWPRVMQPDEDALFFVMTGEAEIELKTEGDYAVQGEIPLERLASKVTVTFTYENYIEKKDNKIIAWVPEVGNRVTKIYLSNGIEHATLGGPLTRDLVGDSGAAATKPAGNGTRDVFEYAYDYMNDIPEVSGKKTAHYYTYPVSLEEGDDNQPYLKLVLPWFGYKYLGTEENPTYDPDAEDFDPEEWLMYKEKEVYYKIVLPRKTITESNKIYEYAVKVNIIGSDREVKITGEEYVVKDWTTKDPVSSNVATGRYISLDIPKDEYDMYVDEIDIAFVSSGTVTAHVDEIYQMDLSNSTPVRQEFMSNDAVTASNALKQAKGLTNDDILGWVSIPEGTSYLRISHEMDNNMFNDNGSKNTAFDMSPYIFKVTLHLDAAGDDTSFDRTITITQYPSLSITAKPSNGYVFVNSYHNFSSTNASTSNSTYWAFDDSKPSTVPGNAGQSSYVLGSCTGIGQNLGSSNNNTNMYAIKASIIKGFDFILGDPRGDVRLLSNLSFNGNYRPSRTEEGARKVVSPYFLTSSAYSKTILWIRDFERAEKRCASFQEGGYPAGRWRLPTEGEISFMVELSNNGFIPSLFMGCPYWASSGRLYNPSTSRFITAAEGADIGDNGVRCIYDLWYWGDEPYEECLTEWKGFYD